MISRQQFSCVTVSLCVLMCLIQACDHKQKQPHKTTPVTPVDAASDITDSTTTDTTQNGAATLEVKDVGPSAPSIFVLNGMKGYTEPCGCTLDVMAGGIDRIAGYIEKRQSMATSSFVIDGGNIWFEAPTIRESRVQQEKLKASLLARAYKDLGVGFTVPGPNDFALGADFFQELTTKAQMTPVAANLTIKGEPLKGTFSKELDGVKVGFVGVVDPALFTEVADVKATEALDALKAGVKALEDDGASVIVFVFQGDMPEAKELVNKVPEVDFVLASYKVEETDRVDALEHASAMQVFDQGRYVGVLKLYPKGEASDRFENARTGSKSELESVQRQIAYVNANINKLPPAAPGEESPMLARLRQRLESLKEEEQKIKHAAVEVPEKGNAFIWQAVRMDEGYPEDAEIKKAKEELNHEIKRVNASQDFELVPAIDGQAFYVGNNQCKTCHAEAYSFWEKTNHGSALHTLEEKGKEFDQTCVSCHVVGFEKPGGSVLGKLEYEVELGDQGYKVQKDLKNVGCENCHGPGSFHVEAALFGKKGDPKQWINNVIDERTCMESCHVQEHSPRFNFDVYVKQITGEGHQRKVD